MSREAAYATDAAASASLLGDNKSTRKLKVDMSALVGLRGVCGIWIMVFHCVLFSKLEWTIEGSSIMPLFLMLSGFALAAVYGKEAPAATGNDKDLEHASAESAPAKEFEFNRWAFYQNRFARVAPLYYLTMLAAIPYTVVGFGIFDEQYTFAPGNIIVNLIPVSTLFSFLLGGPYDGPAWTIATLTVFWCVFPDTLKAAKRMTNEQLVRWIVGCYYVQAVLVFACCFLIPSLGDPKSNDVIMPVSKFALGFMTGTMNPITRYPLFLMGVFASILCQRHETKASSSSSADNLPWPQGFLTYFPHCCGSDSSMATTDWKDVTFWSSLSLLFVTLFFSVMDSGVFDLIGAVTLQAFAPFAQLTVVVGLTRDSSEDNMTYNVLTSPTMKFLGDISMTVYLVHFLFLSYLMWIIKGHGITYCDVFHMTDDGECDAWVEARLIPVWGIPVVIGATMLASPLLYWYLEEPARAMLQAPKKK